MSEMEDFSDYAENLTVDTLWRLVDQPLDPAIAALKDAVNRIKALEAKVAELEKRS
jgi:hypothetical protein